MTAQNPPNLSPANLWAATVDRVKDRVNSRSLWETMEKVVGITIENGIFIIGLDSRFFNEAGHVQRSDHKNIIESTVSSLAGTPLKIRIIEGTTLADWTTTKKNEERIAAMRETTYERRDRQDAEAQNWDTLYEYVSRIFSNTPMRQLPQIRARYLTDMLYVLSDALNQLYPEQPDEQTERQFARVLDRVAQNADVPPSLLALELERLRAWQKQSQG